MTPANPKKIIIYFSIFFSLVLIGILIFYKAASLLAGWDGFVFANNVEAEGNYLSIGKFDTKELCIAAGRDLVKKKQSLTISDGPLKGTYTADSYLCGEVCFFPDGPGDALISEIKCASHFQESAYPDQMFLDELLLTVEPQDFLPTGAWALESMQCSNSRWKDQNEKTKWNSKETKTRYFFSQKYLTQITEFSHNGSDTPFCKITTQSSLEKANDGKSILSNELELSASPKSKECTEAKPRGKRMLQFAKVDKKLAIIFEASSGYEACEKGARMIYILVPRK